MEKSLFRYIRKFSGRQQLTLTLMAAASFPFLYLFYELPKLIINEAIGATSYNFPLDTNFSFSFFGSDFSFDLGILLDQEIFLLTLCFAFLGLVIINQGFKYVINVYKGLTGERMLRRLRYDLYARVLRFPLPTFRKMSQGEIIPMVTAEVEPLGGFIGDAYSLPAFQGGTLITILGFLFYQDWRMASAAVLLYPLQLWLIPKLQRRVNLLGKERVQRVRKLADRIGETVQGVQEIRSHDVSSLTLSIFSARLGEIYDVRYRIYRQKFVIKFLNNFIQQLGPFFFYSIGGIFVIQGELAIGTLVAAIAAHKDLAAPWKELLNYYQQQADANIKYDQVISQFEPAGMRSAELQMQEPETLPVLNGEFKGGNLTLRDDQDVPVIDGVNFEIALDKHTAIVGAGGSGKEEMTLLLANLLDPDQGNISVGGTDLASYPEAVTGRRMSYVGGQSFIFAGSVADNLFFGLKHRPLQPADHDEDEQDRIDAFLQESRIAGNMAHDEKANWIDYVAAGASDDMELRQNALQVLDQMGMAGDVYGFGLRGTIDPAKRPEVAVDILSARRALAERLQNDPALGALVETFDRDSYNANATVAENLLFGTPLGTAFDLERLAENPYVLETLEEVGLTEPFLQIGYQVAATMVEIFADLPPEHELFQQFSFLSAEELPDAQSLLQRTDRDNLSSLSKTDRNWFLSLPFKLIPARHRLGLIEDDIRENILRARHHFADNLPGDLQGAVSFFEIDSYNPAANLQDNILFGKIAYGQAEAQDRVGALIGEVIAELDLQNTVTEVGLDFHVGIAGSRLSGEQRQKLALARGVIKRPDALILNDSLTALDGASQGKVLENILQNMQGRCIIFGLARPSRASQFDNILVLRQGRVVETGDYQSLLAQSGYFKELLDAES